MIDYSTFYDASDLYVYPSSNATDGGRNHTEYNVSQIPYSITQRNYVLRKPELWLQFVDENDPSQGVVLTSGNASIHGYKFEIINSMIFNKSVLESMECNGTDTWKTGTYYVYFTLGRDTQNNLLPDILDSSRFSFKAAECLQVHLSTEKMDELNPDGLLLGSFYYDIRNNTFGDIWNNPRKYFCIDWTQIETYDIDYGYMSLQEYLELMIRRIYQYLDDHYIRKDIDDWAKGRIRFYSHCTFDSGLTMKDTSFVKSPDDESGNPEDPNNFIALNHNRLTICDGNNSIKSQSKITFCNKAGYTGSLNSSNSVSLYSRYIGNEVVDEDTRPEIIVDNYFSASRVYNAVWNDYAELYPKLDPDEIIEAGELVSIDPDTLKCYKTKEPADTKVLGVCTNTYGFILGGYPRKNIANTLKTHVAVATSGQIPVKMESDSDDLTEGCLLKSGYDGKARPLGADSPLGITIGKYIGKHPETKETIMQVYLV